MIFGVQVPLSTGGVLPISVSSGMPLFVLGANGAGKSSLMQMFHRSSGGRSVRITAHRQTWLSSNQLAFSPAQKTQQENFITNQDNQDTARWKDDHAGNRTNLIIYELLDAENVRARNITAAVDSHDLQEASALAKSSAPLSVINDLLQSSNLPLSVSAEKSDSIVARKNGGLPYSIAELSDGERNALLMGASVLTAKTGSLILIDEPERHLHRAIISPFLRQLFSRRDDCAFIVSTHDLTLAEDHPLSQTLLVRDCVYSGSSVRSWTVDLLTSGDQIDDSLKSDILGGRRKILFVEGSDSSLDRPLYSLLFPNTSIIAKESKKEVEAHVRGIRASSQLHWLSAYGLIDGDQLSDSEKLNLRADGIFALTAYSVESLYYDPSIQRLVASRRAELLGGSLEEDLRRAEEEALAAIEPHVRRLSARMIEKSVRDSLLRSAPKWRDIEAATPLNVEVDVPTLFANEESRLRRQILARDVASIVARYPVRETPMLDKIATTLQFKNRDQYEAAVRKMISEDSTARDVLLRELSPLQSALST